ncbi:MAG: ATP-dependent helicase/nuclease subunit A [Rickettsiales bacterium]|jgi:ATP-dependent helicase/nuclease subunit A
MLIKTTNLQNLASNPLNSAFVSASAGSGKTKVLTDRVLRLLLCGARPSKILCLTFTKVAATQMQNRIFKELENWAICDQETLKNQLKKFTSHEPSPSEIKTARKLFANLLDDDFGLQISTIHSFCQGIIKQFPIEAKTSPNFSIINEQQENQLLLDSRKSILKKALTNSDLAEKINLICSKLNETSFLDISFELIKERQKIFWLKEKYFGIINVIDEVFKEVAVGREENEETVFSSFINDSDWRKDDLTDLCQNFSIKNGQEIIKFINNPEPKNLQEYLQVFLTTINEPRKSLVLKPVQKQNPLAIDLMIFEQDRVLKFLEKTNNVNIAVLTSALLEVVDQITGKYEILKNQNGYLDYNDLIIKTNSLLENSSAREWVKYKLDGSYEHILIDESQDTNHSQWDIVKIITEEFFAGEGLKDERELSRTIFIVGDEKQSIYSFQGADPDIFANIFYFYQNQLSLIGKEFLNIELSSSFRSMPTILKTVDQVFAKPELKDSISTLAQKIEHHSIKNHHSGKVELLPIVMMPILEKEEKNYRWKLDFQIKEESKAQEILAQIIAKKIKGLFNEKKFLACKDRFAEFGDVMILLKERKSNLGKFLIKYLSQENIPVSSADRIDFNNNIIVLDLISLAKFILLPEDDLNLSCLLKSIFFNLSEDDLLSNCDNKNHSRVSLFDALKQNNPNLHQELQNLITKNQDQQFSVYEFFSDFLIKKSKQKDILEKYGKEGEEIVNQFLKICIDHKDQNVSSDLQKFVEFLEKSNFQIKIDGSGQNKNQVFITTIHSAKGLEAPIVFLADTAHSTQKQIGNDRSRIFWNPENSLPLWSQGSKFDNSNIKNIKKLERTNSKKEYWRQLYVAMTRAEEELYICGFSKQKIDQDCWYETIKKAIVDEAIEIEDFNIDEKYKEYLFGKNLVVGASFNNHKKLEINIPQEIFKKPAKQNLNKIIPEELSAEIIYPSKTNPDDLQINQYQAEFGKIIHKILELLFNLKIKNIEERKYFLQDYLAKQNLSNEQVGEINQKIEDVFAEFFELLTDEKGKAEVPIIAKIGAKIISGKIDRLIVKDNDALIIDFKTGKINPEKYQTQMDLYKIALQKLYPKKNIKSQIIWL